MRPGSGQEMALCPKLLGKKVVDNSGVPLTRETWGQKTCAAVSVPVLVLGLGVGFRAHAEAAGPSVRIEAGWNLVATPQAPEIVDDWEALGLSVWWGDRETGSTDRTLGAGGLWVFASEAVELPAFSTVQSSTTAAGWRFVSVTRETIFGDPNITRIERWSPLTQGYVTIRLGEQLLPMVGYRAFLQEPGVPFQNSCLNGTGIPEGACARFAALGVATSQAEPGTFEAPAEASPRGLLVALPKVALAAHQDRTWAHLVYAVRDHDGRGEEIRYTKSLRAAQAQSFQTTHTLAKPGAGWTFTDLAITARDQKVSVAWTVHPVGEPQPSAKSHMGVVESHDHGLHFSAPRILRENHAWKRGLDLAYDRFGHHHIVWGEAHKAYYLKNLSGEPQNVFDRVRRDKNTRVVQYDRAYKDPHCHAPNPCDCIEWRPEAYSYAMENDPKTDEPFGPFLDRIEEAWVYNPSLEIDEHTLSIVVHQDRMWDNLPVPNPDWAGALEAQTRCPEEGERIGREGFQEVWRRRAGHPEPTRGERITRAQDGEPLAPEEQPQERRAQGLTPASADDPQRHQFLYDGTWHEQDQIRVAQRPLVAGQWSRPAQELREVPVWPMTHGLLKWRKVQTTVEHGFKQGVYQDGIRHDWRHAVVAQLHNPLHENRQAAPKLVATQKGHLVAVYSDGPSDNAHTPDQNPIFIQQSQDGGLTWTPRTLVTHGYLPDVAATTDGELGLIVFQPAPEPSDAGSVPKIQMFRSRDFNTWDVSPLSLIPPAPIHWNPHQSLAAERIGVPAISSHQDLFVATWVQLGDNQQEGTRVVTSRAARVNLTSRYQIDHHGPLTVGKNAKLTITAVNEYDMRVNNQGTVRIQKPNKPKGALATSSATGDKSLEGSVDALGAPALDLDDPRAQGALALVPTIQLQNGQASLMWAPDGPSTALSVQSVEDLGSPASITTLDAYPRGEEGNYQRAIDARDRMRRTAVDPATGQTWVFQVEYAPAEDDPYTLYGPKSDAMEEGLRTDATYLASYERVWVYTQGIALAQFAKQNDPQAMGDAQGIARYLCAKATRAEVKGQSLIRGWPFSWNTQGDNWEDRRLVTGANAWAIHGLGVFVASKAFEGLEAKEQGKRLRCYEEAIRGLKEHRRRLVDPSTGNTVTLMTAGWTAQGLTAVDRPSEIFVEEDPSVRWGYYSVLDAIGYDHFLDDRPPKIQRLHRNAQSRSDELPPWVLTEAQHQILKKRVLANNVVTEHNLDVLSVLNHALKHQKEIGLTEVAELERWRNELREGIFSLLWDEKGWKADLEYTLQGQNLGENRRAELEEALTQQDLGRIITGGQLTTHDEGERFEANPHVAIDNCSWLSLSVDYTRLPGASETVERLAKCLLYTELQFVKPLRFGTQTYLGAHYFQNAFRDPYIEPSQLQEASFHLEATTGLILGLHRFAQAYPEHPLSKRFEKKAQVLWDGVQAFVQDHGFRYSSQRIQDLSTQLSSSTAAIWFIDVYRERHPPPSPANWMKRFPNAALALYPLMAGLIPKGDDFGLEGHAWTDALSSLVATHTTVPLSHIEGWQTPWRVVHVLTTEENTTDHHSVPFDFSDKPLGSAQHPFPSLASVIHPSIAGTSAVASISPFSPVVVQEPGHRMQLIRPRGMMADILLVKDMPHGSPSAPTRFELHPDHGGHFSVNVAPVLSEERVFVACASDPALLSTGLDPSVDASTQLDGQLWLAPVGERTVSTRLQHEAGPNVLHGRFQAKELRQTVWPFKPHDTFYQTLHCAAFKEARSAELRLVSLMSPLQTFSHGVEDLALEVTALREKAEVVATFTPPEGVDIVQEATLNLVKKDHQGNVLDVMTKAGSWWKAGEITFSADGSLSIPKKDNLHTFLDTVGEEEQLSAVLSFVGLDGNRVVALPADVDFAFEDDGMDSILTETLLGFFQLDENTAPEPGGQIVSFGLSGEGQAYVGVQDQGAPIWVNANTLEHAKQAFPETQNLVGSVSRYAKPGTVLAHLVKKGTGSVDSLKNPGAATTQLVAAGTTLASLVALSAGQVETWTTLIHLNSAPDETTEPWTFVGHVPESEVTFSGFFFKDEGLIRRDVRISQSHVQGGLETSTLAFDENAIYGLVKEVYGPQDGVFQDLYRIGLPTGEPVAVYRLDTHLAPEQIVEAVIDLQYPWLKQPTLGAGTDPQTSFAHELWDHVKALALTPDFQNIDLTELIDAIETQAKTPPSPATGTPPNAAWLDQVPEPFRASVYYWTVLAPQYGAAPSSHQQPSLWDALQNDLQRLDEHACRTIGPAYASRFPGVQVGWVPESSTQPGRCVAATHGAQGPPTHSPTGSPAGGGSKETGKTGTPKSPTPDPDAVPPKKTPQKDAAPTATKDPVMDVRTLAPAPKVGIQYDPVTGRLAVSPEAKDQVGPQEFLMVWVSEHEESLKKHQMKQVDNLWDLAGQDGFFGSVVSSDSIEGGTDLTTALVDTSFPHGFQDKTLHYRYWSVSWSYVFYELLRRHLLEAQASAESGGSNTVLPDDLSLSTFLDTYDTPPDSDTVSEVDLRSAVLAMKKNYGAKQGPPQEPANPLLVFGDNPGWLFGLQDGKMTFEGVLRAVEDARDAHAPFVSRGSKALPLRRSTVSGRLRPKISFASKTLELTPDPGLIGQTDQLIIVRGKKDPTTALPHDALPPVDLGLFRRSDGRLVSMTEAELSESQNENEGHQSVYQLLNERYFRELEADEQIMVMLQKTSGLTEPEIIDGFQGIEAGALGIEWQAAVRNLGYTPLLFSGVGQEPLSDDQLKDLKAVIHENVALLYNNNYGYMVLPIATGARIHAGWDLVQTWGQQDTTALTVTGSLHQRTTKIAARHVFPFVNNAYIRLIDIGPEDRFFSRELVITKSESKKSDPDPWMRYQQMNAYMGSKESGPTSKASDRPVAGRFSKKKVYREQIALTDTDQVAAAQEVFSGRPIVQFHLKNGGKLGVDLYVAFSSGMHEMPFPTRLAPENISMIGVFSGGERNKIARRAFEIIQQLRLKQSTFRLVQADGVIVYRLDATGPQVVGTTELRDDPYQAHLEAEAQYGVEEEMP